MRPCRLSIPVLALTVAACAPQPATHQAPAPAAPPAPTAGTAPQAPVAVTERLRALGTEPFWAVDVEGNRLLYTTPENQDGTVLTARQTPFAGGITWSGTHAGQPFSLTLREDGVCSDGMSEREYRYHADFDIGGQQLKGCAERIDVLETTRP